MSSECLPVSNFHLLVALKDIVKNRGSPNDVRLLLRLSGTDQLARDNCRSRQGLDLKDRSYKIQSEPEFL